ncbi:MAG: ribonuclease domain-containing protein [Deltaproteobacteria bacterium]
MSVRAWLSCIALGLALVALPAHAQRGPAPNAAAEDVGVSQLPREAQETIARIRKGGPFPYAKDGAVFGNREGTLPRAKRGYYREYTVKTPGVRSRGARRIVAGAGGEMYYSDDHYNHFRRIRE